MNKFLFCLLAVMVFLSACQTSQVDPDIDCSVEGPNIQVVSTDSDCAASTGTVTVSVTGGTAPFTYAINANGFEDNATGIFEGLSAGTYSVSVIDGNECTVQENVTVQSPDGPQIDEVNQTSVAGCDASNGSITINASGGTGALSYSLSGGTPQPDPVFNRLEAGSYTLVVADESGCETQEVVDVLSGVSLEADIISIITQNCAVSGCHNGSQSPDLSTPSAIIGSASRIRSRTSARSMPPSTSTPLTDAQIDLISCWVNDGAPNN